VGRLKTSGKKLEAANRCKLCVHYRLAGYTFVEIGEKVGCSAKTAHKWVTKTLHEIQTTYRQDANSLRTQELQALDQLKQTLWAKGRQGNLQAIDRLLKISERRAKLLGIDAPDTYEHTGAGGTPLLAPVIVLPRAKDE